MKSSLLEILRCPRCASPFTVTTLTEDEQEIREAHLICQGRRHFFEVRGGILRLCAGFDHALVKKEIAYEDSTYHGDARLTDPAIISQFPDTLPDLWPHTAHFGPDFAALIDRINIRPGDWVLDIGTGPCWSSRLLAQRGARVIALDVNDSKFYGLGSGDLLFDTHGVYFERILESMTHLPLADASIDRITFNASLHHTPDLPRTLQECARVLKPDGIIAMVNEEFGSLRHRLFPSADCSDTGSHHQIRYREFETAAKEAGFSVKYFVAEHVRAQLHRKFPAPLAQLALAAFETFSTLLQQLNSALILLTKNGCPPVSVPSRTIATQPKFQAIEPKTASAPPVVMLGVPFDNVTTAQTVELVQQMVASRQPHHLVTANVDFLTQALHDVELHRILTDAHLVLCDGTPLVWASRFLGNPLPERVAGSDLAPLLIKVSAQAGYRIFFLGGSAESTGQAVANLRRQYPGLDIAGHYSPPFAALLEMDHDEICRRIKDAKPDLLLVAFGCPKQEKWIAMHYRSLGVPVVVGVGATIDFLAGTVRRAPVWMQQAGLEWVFRLLQEPRRLLGRYARDLTAFSTEIVRQWWLMQWKARGGRQNVGKLRREWEKASAGAEPCLLNLSQVTSIDSTGVGLLLRWQRQARREIRPFVLVAPNRAVRSALALMRVDGFFTIASDRVEARRLLRDKGADSPVCVRQNYFPSKTSVFWQGEITVTNAPEVWEATAGRLARQDRADRRFFIDASALRFIDSAGARLMQRAKQAASQVGLELVYTGIAPDVRNVLRLARVESFVLGAAP
jgi:N-acetylglucosaminyldiphosphoundecaprenol N-acetyl-beta-D-mannosaminyltransferase